MSRKDTNADNGNGSEYSEEDCIEALKEAAEILGKSPTEKEYSELDIYPSIWTIKKIMGTWNNAKEITGLKKCKRGGFVHYSEGSIDYMRWQHTHNNKSDKVLEHRLLATLLVDDIQELKGKVVHHINHHKIDNRLDNIEIVDNEEHLEYHNTTDFVPIPLRGDVDYIPLDYMAGWMREVESSE